MFARRVMQVALCAVLGFGLAPARAAASVCDTPSPDWLMCEDFEGAGAGWRDWFAGSGFMECRGCSGDLNNPDRLLLSEDPDHVFEGNWGLHMPAAAGAGFQGAELIFHTCVGEPREGCAQTNYERLYLRTRVRLAPDHEYVHHFLGLGGTRAEASAYWEGSGTAGCRPDGVRHAGTDLDFSRDHNLWFYTYYPEMRCDSGGYCSGSYADEICAGCGMRGLPCTRGPECCWGNRFSPPEPRTLPRGEWVCLEVMMEMNTPGAADGQMAFWMNDELMHRETGMQWRNTMELGLNRAGMSHFIDRGDAERPNRVSFDDFIVSTSPIGCDVSIPEVDAGGPASDGGMVAIADGSVATDGGRVETFDGAIARRDGGAGGGDGALGGSCHVGSALGRTPSPNFFAWATFAAIALSRVRRRRR